MTSRAPGSAPVPPGRISVSRARGVLTVRVTGEVDMWLRSQVPDVLAAVRSHPGPVEVDLGGVTFFGAEGVRIVLALLGARPRGVVAIVATSRPVERTMDLLGLAGDLPRLHDPG